VNNVLLSWDSASLYISGGTAMTVTSRNSSTVLISGGSFFVDSRDQSNMTILDGVFDFPISGLGSGVAGDDSVMSIFGGTFREAFVARSTQSTSINGGNFFGSVTAELSNELSITGGGGFAELLALDTATILITGTSRSVTSPQRRDADWHPHRRHAFERSLRPSLDGHDHPRSRALNRPAPRPRRDVLQTASAAQTSLRQWP